MSAPVINVTATATVNDSPVSPAKAANSTDSTPSAPANDKSMLPERMTTVCANAKMPSATNCAWMLAKLRSVAKFSDAPRR